LGFFLLCNSFHIKINKAKFEWKQSNLIFGKTSTNVNKYSNLIFGKTSTNVNKYSNFIFVKTSTNVNKYSNLIPHQMSLEIMLVFTCYHVKLHFRSSYPQLMPATIHIQHNTYISELSLKVKVIPRLIIFYI
jgi:hypothetical protein